MGFRRSRPRIRSSEGLFASDVMSLLLFPSWKNFDPTTGSHKNRDRCIVKAFIPTIAFRFYIIAVNDIYLWWVLNWSRPSDRTCEANRRLSSGSFLMSFRTSAFSRSSAGSPLRPRVPSSDGKVQSNSPRGGERRYNMVAVDIDSKKDLTPDSSSKRRKTSFLGTSYWVIFFTALTLHVSIMIANFVVFDVLGGKRDIQFASLLWGIMNTAISCMNLSALRSCAVPVLAKFTSNTKETTRRLFDDTLLQPMSRLWIGLMVGVCFTYAATGFDLPPWTQMRFSATSYVVSVAWSFSLLSTFQQLSAGD